MKKFLIIFFLFNSFFSNLSLSAEKIVYLDLDFILANSNKGKFILSNLEKLNKKNIEILKSKENLIKKEEKEIIKQKNIISNEAYNDKINNLKNKIKILREEKNKLAKDFTETRKTKINEFFKTIDKVLREYVENNSIDLVLNKKDILIGKNNYNITDEILKIVNELK